MPPQPTSGAGTAPRSSARKGGSGNPARSDEARLASARVANVDTGPRRPASGGIGPPVASADRRPRSDAESLDLRATPLSGAGADRLLAIAAARTLHRAEAVMAA